MKVSIVSGPRHGHGLSMFTRCPNNCTLTFTIDIMQLIPINMDFSFAPFIGLRKYEEMIGNLVLITITL